MALIIDTGPLYAFLDRSDRDHVSCRALLEETRERRVIPEPVLVEMDYWVRTTMDAGVLSGLLDDIADGAFAVEAVEPADRRRIRMLLDTYAGSDIGYVDAAVLAITERLDEPKLATLDHRHFAMMRPSHVESLELLPG